MGSHPSDFYLQGFSFSLDEILNQFKSIWSDMYMTLSKKEIQLV
jgi:hypothetical protein